MPVSFFFIVPNKSRPPHSWWGSPHWSSTGLTPFLGRPGQCGYFYATPTGRRLTTTYDLTCNRPIHGGSSVESGFEPGTLRLQSRDLTTRPPWPLTKWKSVYRGDHFRKLK
ncbi:hypothetical protein AVEN_90466-1 [Araneus ventricosus]|uniref:Uncharacterized protein n=1 Tax=Araneus ventricosus TaxID=182803 RepID=A0A4Y2L113_ARAVE|nr:hypothetical protein AVEN_90466-1 [Araneus ventricosus]